MPDSPPEPPHGPLAVPSRRLIPALVLVTGIGPFATDMYISALPEVARSLATTGAVAQLTLTAYLVGLATGQLLLGPTSDATGRRVVLWGDTSVFAVASLVCAVTPGAPLFLLARLVQGLAAGAGVVVGRAVVSDLYPGPVAARTFGTLASIAFLAPLLAPILGQLVITHSSWRWVFGTLALAGVGMLLAVAWGIPESLPPERRHEPGLSRLLPRMADLARDGAFMQHVVVGLCASAGFFTYIGGSSLVLQTTYGMTPQLYTVMFARRTPPGWR